MKSPTWAQVHLNLFRFSKPLAGMVTIALCNIAVTGCAMKDQSISIPSFAPITTTPVTYLPFAGVTTAETVGATKVKLTWTASSDPSVVAYNIYDVSSLFTPKLLRTVLSPLNTVTLTGLTTETLYTFRVRASNAQMVEDANTTSVQAIPYAGIVSATVLSSTSANVTFSDGSNADQINIYCMTNLSPTYTLIKTVTDVTQTQATLTGLTAGSQYTCRAALQMTGFEDNNTKTVTFTPIGQATQLVFSTQPGSAVAGVPFSPQPIVKILDANNNVVSAGPDATALISLSISGVSPTGGSLSAAVTAVGGIATFTGVNLQNAGDKIITAKKNDTSAQTYGSGPLSVDSNTFTITPAAVSASTSSIAITPVGPLVANGSAAYTVSIVLKDQYGNPVSGVKPTFASTNGADTISQPTTNTDTTGTTTGSITTTVAGTRTLSISSPSGLTSDSVVANFVAGPATKLAFSQQPANSPAGVGTMNTIMVAVEDVQGNVVTTSSASVSLSIFVNPGGGTLSGTTSLTAVNGVATFNGLGISKTGTGYKLVANSAPLSVAYSNAFNVTAGVPSKILLSGPNTILSGNCSTAFTLQLQDAGGNPSNATANTLISLTGLGSGGFYLSSTCAGSPVGSSVTFATGSNTKTLYFKDLKAQALTLSASDPSAVMSAGTEAINTTPSQVAMSGPVSVVAGKCSAAFTISTSGADSTLGNVVVGTPFQINGLTGSQGSFYSDAACATPALNPNSINVAANSSSATIYFKDNKAESLTLGVVDPSSVITTTSGNQPMTVLASNINFTGPSSVVSGACSTAFTITLKDAAGNSVAAPADTTLAINGLSGHSGSFYANNACSGSALGANAVVPQNSSSTMIYFKDTTAENLNIYLSDATLQLANSATINLGVSPSALTITAPVAGNAKTNVCAGPFTINTRDGGGSITAAITPITVNLTGAGTAGAFYSDNLCASTVTSYTFNAGDSAKSFYFVGLAPGGLTFTATDSSAVLTAGTAAWSVLAAPAWIGTGGGSGSGGTATMASGSPFTWQQNKVPVAARLDAPQSVQNLHFDSTRQYLYVVDISGQRVFKYDYLHQQYIGWLGWFTKTGNIGMTGANQFTDATTGNPYLSATVSNQCISSSGGLTPGWCQGGQSQAVNGNTGGFYQPWGVTDDGTYVYVTNNAGWNVGRYNALTGQFTGWIGRIYSNSGLTSGIDSNGNSLGTCSSANEVNTQSPGWCQAGANTQQNQYNFNGANYGDGNLYYPTAIARSSTGYIYVAVQGMINRYNTSSGAFAGWIGKVGATSLTINAVAHSIASAPGASNTCSTAAASAQTPGWCVWGTSSTGNNTTVQTGGIDRPTGLLVDDANDFLYVAQNDNSGTITQFQLSTGAFIKKIVTGGVPTSFSGINAISSDGTFLYIADNNRILKIDFTGTMWGWIGKVSNNSSMSDASGNSGAGCSTLAINANTPGWCMGGSARYGMDEQSVHQLSAIDFDGSGNILTGQGGTYPAIKKWATSNGVYQGMLSNTANSPTSWQNSQVYAGYYGYDDTSMFNPSGMYSDGTNLYVTEIGAERLKKISLSTGATLGWVGGVGGFIPGATPLAGCGTNSIGYTTGWCLGAFFSPAYLLGSMAPTSGAIGIMNNPLAVTGNGTYLFVVDQPWHRILRFDATTGAFKGWIGGINGSATVGPATPSDSSSCTGAVNQFTPGWCIGGGTTAGSGNGYLNNPNAITFYNGNLYVIDGSNHRISSYNATTGAFLGWIGRTNSTVGLSPAAITNGGYSYTNGWSTGGTSQASVGGDPGGGFNFWNRGGLATDGTYLYVTNFYNSRVDRFNLTTGLFQGAARFRWDTYTNVWTNPATWKAWGTTTSVGSWGNEGWYSTGMWLSGTTLYYTAGNGSGVVVKMNLTTGSVIGWQGAISGAPSGGDAGCVGATGTTPGWCQGGNWTQGFMLGDPNHLGGFSGNNYGITGDANFVYVSDENTHRITRLPR